MDAEKISDGEILLLDEWRQGDELALKKLIKRYERQTFSLALYLSGCGRDHAFALTVSSFVRVIRRPEHAQRDGDFLLALLRVVIEECKKLPPVAKFDLSDFDTWPDHKRGVLRIMKQALATLSFDHKKTILLRDQLHLAYKDIAALLDVSERDARIQTLHARTQLRDKVKDIIEFSGTQS